MKSSNNQILFTIVILVLIKKLFFQFKVPMMQGVSAWCEFRHHLEVRHGVSSVKMVKQTIVIKRKSFEFKEDYDGNAWVLRITECRQAFAASIRFKACYIP